MTGWNAKVDTLNEVLGNEMRQIVSRWSDLKALSHSPSIVSIFWLSFLFNGWFQVLLSGFQTVIHLTSEFQVMADSAFGSQESLHCCQDRGSFCKTSIIYLWGGLLRPSSMSVKKNKQFWRMMHLTHFKSILYAEINSFPKVSFSLCWPLKQIRMTSSNTHV